MAKTTGERSGTPRPDADDHGPLRPKRIPPSEYTSKFLTDLQVQKQVLPVREGWEAEGGSLPPGVKWVIYPNGDLQRL